MGLATLKKRKKILEALTGNNISYDDTANETDEDDNDDSNEKALLILEAISICDSEAAFKELLGKLQALSPITPANRNKYDALFLEYAHNDKDKEKRLKEIVETLFGG